MKNIYFYASNEDGSIIGILCTRKPIKRRETYIVREYSIEYRQWVMASFPEITYNYLIEHFTYIGKCSFTKNFGS